MRFQFGRLDLSHVLAALARQDGHPQTRLDRIDVDAGISGKALIPHKEKSTPKHSRTTA